MSHQSHSWTNVLRGFDETAPDFEPMANLITRICQSPYRDHLFPVKSMFSLLLFQTENWEFQREMLKVDYSIKDRKLRFEFFEHPNLATRWKKDCPVEEGYSALIHFLRLKNWFPVAEVPRGS